MPPFTHEKILVSDSETCVFGGQILTLSKFLNLEPPTFLGRKLSTSDPALNRWEVQAELQPRVTPPTSERIIFTKVYPNWNVGAAMAMAEMLARMVEAFEEEFPPDSAFGKFGKRTKNGGTLITPDEADWTQIQLEEMECHNYGVESVLRREMTKLEEAHLRIMQEKEQVEDMRKVALWYNKKRYEAEQEVEKLRGLMKLLKDEHDTLRTKLVSSDGRVHELEQEMQHKDEATARLISAFNNAKQMIAELTEERNILQENLYGNPQLVLAPPAVGGSAGHPEPEVYITTGGKEIKFSELDDLKNNTRAMRAQVEEAREFFKRHRSS